MGRLVRRAAEPLAAIVTAAVGLAHLLGRARVLRRADVVGIMDGGFAHTINAPDLLRRLFPGRRLVLICFSEHGRHNRKTAEIWGEVDVIFLPVNFWVKVRGRTISMPSVRWRWWKRIGPVVVRRLLRVLAGGGQRTLSLDEMYALAGVPGAVSPADGRIPSRPSGPREQLYYLRLRNLVPAPPVRLPEASRCRVDRALRELVPRAMDPGRVKRCCLYLRQKGAENDVGSFRRNGSPLRDYPPTIDLLNRLGYQVLLVGDLALDRDLGARFDGMLVEAGSAGVEKSLFDLYAATEADIFIGGAAGGGTHVSGLNGIPQLLLNAFPYAWALPRAWMYYKSVRDSRGEIVDAITLFEHHAYDFDLAGMTLHDNSAEEIYEAVECFVLDVTAPHEPSGAAEVVSRLPDHAWVKLLDARLSPAWVRRYMASPPPGPLPGGGSALEQHVTPALDAGWGPGRNDGRC